ARKNEQAAVAAHAELEKGNAELRQARDELEAALAHSQLRPLGLERRKLAPPRPLTEPEIEVLWELAGRQSKGVRQRFVREALRQPVLTRQLQNRAEVAMHAAVGLDPQQREAVEGFLRARLEQGAVSEDQR